MFFFFQFSLKYSVYFACTYFLCNVILYVIYNILCNKHIKRQKK